MESENRDKTILVYFSLKKRLLDPTNSHIGEIKRISLQTAKSLYLYCSTQEKAKRSWIKDNCTIKRCSPSVIH